MPRTSEPGRSVSSRLLQLLFAFEPDEREMSLARLSRKTGLAHATARRLVHELVDVGALEQRDDGRFMVGLRLWQLGTLAPLTESLRSMAAPFMEDLYAALKQHVQLAVLDGNEAAIIDRLSAPEATDLVSQVGGRLPLHCSGVGKILLSHGGSGLIEDICGGELRRYTDKTITDPFVLRDQIDKCRRTGGALVEGELSDEVDSIATRIMDYSGHVIASLSIVVVSGSIRPEVVAPTLITSGLGISRRLGWRPGIRIRY